MKPNGRPERSGLLLSAMVMGVVDGILTALTLAAGLIVDNARSMTLALALRVAAAAFFSGAFVYFVAKYTEFRHQLVHAERELSLASRGQLAVTHLGRTIIREAVVSAAMSSTAAFVGAFGPLIVAVLFPRYHWAAVAAALIALGLLGGALAKMMYGNILRWSLTLILGGALLTAVGIKLAIL
jgi:predicted membrane protein (TIGR00267 family)